MKSWIANLENYWFSPMPAERIAILRIATGGFSLWYLLTRFNMLQKLGRTEASLFEPLGLATFLREPLPMEWYNALLWLTIGLNILYLIGWKFRQLGPVFAIVLLFFMSYRNSWSMIYHNYNALVLHVFVLGFVPAADALSFDTRRLGKESIMPHWRYGWGVRLICAATVIAYFLSGLAKVYGDLAWEWVSGSAMRSQVAVDALRKEILGGGEASPLFQWLYPYTEIFLLLGVGTMILELGAPLALLHKKIAIPWALLTCSMHWGIYFIMGIDFPYHTSGLIFLSFFAVEKGWFWLQQLFQKPIAANNKQEQQEQPVVLFDGICNFCNSSVQFIIKRDTAARFRFASLQSEAGKALLQHYGVSGDLSTIVLIENGKVFTKSSAALRIARSLVFPWNLLSFLMIIPKPLRDFFYDLIARNRYRWFGVKTECKVMPVALKSRFL